MSIPGYLGTVTHAIYYTKYQSDNIKMSRGSWGPVDILVAATVLAAYSVFRVPV